MLSSMAGEGAQKDCLTALQMLSGMLLQTCRVPSCASTISACGSLQILTIMSACLLVIAGKLAAT